MKLKITMIILFIGLNTSAQSTFKKGYVVNNDGQKKEGFFMSYGTHLPDEIAFKEKWNSPKTNRIKTAELSELNIDDMKFVKKDVSIEFLDKNMFAKKENNTMAFNLNSKKLFLKVLLEFNGFTLYYYHRDNNDYFFIETQEGIEFLKYKKIKKNGKTIKIKDFRKELLQEFKIIDSLNQGIIGGVKYNKSDFIDYFLKYANQNNHQFKKYKSYNFRSFKDAFNITPKFGYSFISQSTQTESNNFRTSFSESQISLGVDIEFFFNSEFKKSSIILSYIYNTKINNEGNFSFGSTNDSKVFNTLTISNIHFSFRQYLKLFNKHNLYANIGVLMPNTSGGTEYIFTPTNALIANIEYGDNRSLAFSLGLGYNFNNLYFELNYTPNTTESFETETQIATTENNWVIDRSFLNLSIGYAIF